MFLQWILGRSVPWSRRNRDDDWRERLPNCASICVRTIREQIQRSFKEKEWRNNIHVKTHHPRVVGSMKLSDWKDQGRPGDDGIGGAARPGTGLASISDL
ncbi:hypothetical protein IG631_19644 [Alternaria alternata]|nr:hypothetical protein IG631_19644 [Alternaria alternata]